MAYALNFALELVDFASEPVLGKVICNAVALHACTAVVVMFTPLQWRPQHERVMICQLDLG